MSDDQTKQIDEGNTSNLPSGEDIAISALSDASVNAVPASETVSDTTMSDDEELLKSNELAETLTSLQRLIERYANQHSEVSNELKEKRDSLKNVFDNDSQLGEAKAQAEIYSEQLKTRKSQMQAEPQVTSLKVQISELNDQKKEIEETLSNHLVNYHSMTNSKSFDTSDGDQWEFNIKAKIKTRKK